MSPSIIIASSQMPWWDDGGHMMGMHWIWWLVWVPILLMLVWALARVYGGRERPSAWGAEASAEERLRRCFAEGEMNEEEFTALYHQGHRDNIQLALVGDRLYVANQDALVRFDRRVPELLLSGHHERIRSWRREAAERITRERRPDLWQAHRRRRGATRPRTPRAFRHRPRGAARRGPQGAVHHGHHEHHRPARRRPGYAGRRD